MRRRRKALPPGVDAFDEGLEGSAGLGAQLVGSDKLTRRCEERDAALAGDNLFAVLMDAVRSCSLGEITHTLFDVGGRYRRNV